MKKLIVFKLLIVLTFYSCDRRSDEKGITGNWYYFDSDSLYNELYFSEELFIYNLNGATLSPIYNYRMSNDSIYISDNDFDHSDEFMFKLSSYMGNGIDLIDNEGRVIKLLRIKDKINLWAELNMSEKMAEGLKKGWFIRNNKIIYGSSLNVEEKEDSTIMIPPVEKAN